MKWKRLLRDKKIPHTDRCVAPSCVCKPVARRKGYAPGDPI